MWTTDEAVLLARVIEAVATKHGYHVALTGGLLYKDGPRKDADIMFYRIRHWVNGRMKFRIVDRRALFIDLAKIGLEVFGPVHGWVYKAMWFDNRGVDLFFPEANDIPAPAAEASDPRYGIDDTRDARFWVDQPDQDINF